jgi:N-glycosylase/DNA lyase
MNCPYCNRTAELIEVALWRAERVRAKLADLVVQRGPDNIGELLGDMNMVVNNLEEALRVYRRKAF